MSRSARRSPAGWVSGPVIVDSVFATIIDAVNAGKCDIVISSMTITAARKEQVDLITYFQAGQAFVVAVGNPENVHTQEDLCGKSVAAQTGTVEVDYLEGTGEYEGEGLSAACESAGLDPIDIQTYQKDTDAMLSLQSGQVSAYFVDFPVAGYNVAQHPDSFELSGLALEVVKQGIVDTEAQILAQAAGAARPRHDGARRQLHPPSSRRTASRTGTSSTSSSRSSWPGEPLRRSAYSPKNSTVSRNALNSSSR